MGVRGRGKQPPEETSVTGKSTVPQLQHPHLDQAATFNTISKGEEFTDLLQNSFPR